MKYLLIVAHGSRRETSNEEVRELAKAIASSAGHEFDRVDAAFLEIAEPSIPDGLENCIEHGASEIVVFPYFLAAGRHVVEDVPGEAAKVIEKHPQVTIRIANHLGMSADIPQLIINSVNSK